MRIVERILVLQRQEPVRGMAELHAVTSTDEGIAGEAYPLSVIRVKAPPVNSEAKVLVTIEEHVIAQPGGRDIDELALAVKRRFDGKTFACPLGIVHHAWHVTTTVQPYQRNILAGVDQAPGALLKAVLTWAAWVSWGREIVS